MQLVCGNSGGITDVDQEYTRRRDVEHSSGHPPQDVYLGVPGFPDTGA